VAPSSAEKVTPSAAMDSIAISGPRPQEKDVRPFLVIVRPPAPELLIEPFAEAFTWQVPFDRPGERDGDGAAWALGRSSGSGDAWPETLEAHPDVSSATAAMPTSAGRHCAREIFTAGIVPVPTRGCHAGP
jgi:hypothetical protein